MANIKYIRDPLYGDVEVGGLFLELVETPEMQRLLGIKQLGYTYLVYPGANHSRFEHSLGTFHIAKKMCEALSCEVGPVCIAALLHDIGHLPFSHTLEYLRHLRNGDDHVTLTRELIAGKRCLPDCEAGGTVCEVLKRNGFSPQEVVAILDGSCGLSSAVIHGYLDADQLDYVVRDAFYTGVAYGFIDVDRILQTMDRQDDRIVFDKKGVSCLESMLVARALMYSSVYLHKTVRIAELMLTRAVARAEPFDFTFMTDCELLSHLHAAGGYPQEIVGRLKYRHLFKRALYKKRDELEREGRELVVPGEGVTEMEDRIAAAAGLPEGHVIVDVPGRDILLSEPRMARMDVPVRVNGDTVPLHILTPLIDALKRREITEWAVMVCCPEKYRAEVARAAEKILFS
jgi:hypothetical protein